MPQIALLECQRFGQRSVKALVARKLEFLLLPLLSCPLFLLLSSFLFYRPCVCLLRLLSVLPTFVFVRSFVSFLCSLLLLFFCSFVPPISPVLLSLLQRSSHLPTNQSCLRRTVIQSTNEIVGVARVRRRGENIHPQILSYVANLKNMGRQGILVFYQWKNGMGVATQCFGHQEP